MYRELCSKHYEKLLASRNMISSCIIEENGVKCEDKVWYDSLCLKHYKDTIGYCIQQEEGEKCQEVVWYNNLCRRHLGLRS